MQSDASAAGRLSISPQHTLMVTHLPALVGHLRQRQQETALRIAAGNLEECLGQLRRGESDLLLCFEHPQQPSVPDPGTLRRLGLGKDRLLPVFDPARYQPPVNAGGRETLKLLTYPEDNFLGQVIQSQCLVSLARELPLEIVYECAFAVGIKEMILAGMGIAWLPLSLIYNELVSGRLRSLEHSLGGPELEIALYCLVDSTRPVLQQTFSMLLEDPSVLDLVQPS